LAQGRLLLETDPLRNSGTGCGTGHVSAHIMGQQSKNLSEKSLVDRIRAFQRSTQSNKRCADCGEIGPTYICSNFQTFVCQTCSGIHREFGHKIKAISLSQWTFDEVKELVEAGGNDQAALEWLARRPTEEGVRDVELSSASDPQRVRDIIREKYVEKRWRRRDADRHQKPPAPAGAKAPASPRSPQAAAATSAGGGAAAPPTPAAVPATYPGWTADFAPPSQPSIAVAAGGLLGGVDFLDLSPSGIPSAVLELTSCKSSETVAHSVTQDDSWAADFGAANLGSLGAAAVDVAASDDLFGLDFSGGSGDAAPNGALPAASMATDDGSATQTTTIVGSTPTAGEKPADATGGAGDRLREAVMNGCSTTELNRLFSESAAVAEQPMRATPNDRFGALRSTCGMAGSFPGQSSISSLALPQLAALPAPSMVPPATSLQFGATAPHVASYSHAWPQMDVAPLHTMQLGMQQDPHDQPSGAPSQKFTSLSLPDIMAPQTDVSAFTTPAPAMPTQEIGMFDPQQLGRMQYVLMHALQAHAQVTSTMSSDTSVPQVQQLNEVNESDSPSSSPKEKMFGDLLTMFNEKHPFDGLTIGA